MIKEIKKKMDKFTSVVSYFDHSVDSTSNMATLNSMKAVSAFVDIHHIGTSFERDYGVNWIGYKQVPPAKQLIGHVLANFRGDGLAVFTKPSVVFAPKVEDIYNYAAHNRMERAYGFYIGTKENPDAVGVAAPLLEHMFHTIPQNIMADGPWIRWIHGWVIQTLIGGRYFDATAILSVRDTPAPIASPEPVKAPETPVTAPVVVLPPPAPPPQEPVKRRPGRPKTKK